MKIHAPFASCPACKGLGMIPRNGFYTFCITCEGSGRVMVLPDPLKPMAGFNVLVMVAVWFVFLGLGIWLVWGLK